MKKNFETLSRPQYQSRRKNKTERNNETKKRRLKKGKKEEELVPKRLEAFTLKKMLSSNSFMHPENTVP
jgi:hypothetical protein